MVAQFCTPPCGLHLRSHAFAQQRNSPHSHSAAFAALFCQVPHTSPEGLRLHSSAAPPDARELPAVRIRAQLHRLLLPSPDPCQPHCFCCALFLHDQNCGSHQNSLTCPRHSAALRARSALQLSIEKALHSALTGSICSTCRIARRQSTRSSPHARPGCTTIASACIRSQMRLSTCPAPHSSPGGLRLCSSAFARSGTATGCIRSRLPSVQ